MREGWDDEQLLAALREAVRDRQAVPPWFVEMATNAYAWHNIDAELAQLTYDSENDADRLAHAVSGRLRLERVPRVPARTASRTAAAAAPRGRDVVIAKPAYCYLLRVIVEVPMGSSPTMTAPPWPQAT